MEDLRKEEITYPKKKVRRLCNDLERTVDKKLKEIGLKENVKGYQYLIDAITLVIKNARKLDALTKTLYPEIAIKNNTTPSCVERSIRHSIELMWKNGKLDRLWFWFGYTPIHTNKRPTNSETIAIISDKIKLQYGRKL